MGKKVTFCHIFQKSVDPFAFAAQSRDLDFAEKCCNCLSLKKVDSQKARINVYLSNTEERTVL